MLPSDVNPSISTLVQNSQRANPAFGKKARKQKPKKVKSRISAQLQGDMTNLSDDMLGDMDPDEYRERDSASQFKEKMKQWREESEKKKKGDGDDKPPEKEEPPEPKGDEVEIMDDEVHQVESLEIVEAGKEVEEEKVDLSDELLEEDKENKEIVELSKDKKSKIIEEIEEAKKYKDPLVDEIVRESVEKAKKAKKVRKKSEEEESVLNAPEVELSKEEHGRKKPLAMMEEPKGFVSLLSYDDGFIIADPKKQVIASDGDSLVSEESIEEPEFQQAAVSESLRARFNKVFEKMLIWEGGEEVIKELKKQLALFGVGVLEMCADNDERVLIIPDGKNLADYDDLLNYEYEDWVYDLRWGYFPEEKLVFLGEEVVMKKEQRVKIPVLYFAFAFDHALGDEGFASERALAIISNYKSCKDREYGRRFIDTYSAESLQHYFAQAVEAFLTAPFGKLTLPDNKSERLLCSKEELYDMDRPLYSYIEYMFNKHNKRK